VITVNRDPGMFCRSFRARTLSEEKRSLATKTFLFRVPLFFNKEVNMINNSQALYVFEFVKFVLLLVARSGGVVDFCNIVGANCELFDHNNLKFEFSSNHHLGKINRKSNKQINNTDRINLQF
jgi:hypothetical protein